MKRIIISRTDSIGDVILTLPVAGVLKRHFPDCKIFFLAKNYTRPIVEACGFVDEFVEWDSQSQQSAVGSRQSLKPAASSQQPIASSQWLNEINADIIIHAFPVKEICFAAKKAGIPVRIATSHRWYTWLTCNKLLHFSRKNSDLHEAQLNLKMLEAIGIPGKFDLTEVPSLYGLTRFPHSQFPKPEARSQKPVANAQIPEGNDEQPDARSQKPEASSQKRADNLILHPKSKGSAREWGLDNFSGLIDLLPPEKYNIFITGTKEEGAMMAGFLQKHASRVTDLTGKLTLTELIGFINSCDGLVAASTGPLHIAAALGKQAIGLYAPMKPIYPKRWAPLGKNAEFLVLDKKCNDCRRSGDCECIRSIQPEKVVEILTKASFRK
ncbi:MAG: glycosyltransferase family 9 protein [Bacteroidota bacterium]